MISEKEQSCHFAPALDLHQHNRSAKIAWNRVALTLVDTSAPRGLACPDTGTGPPRGNRAGSGDRNQAARYASHATVGGLRRAATWSFPGRGASGAIYKHRAGLLGFRPAGGMPWASSASAQNDVVSLAASHRDLLPKFACLGRLMKYVQRRPGAERLARRIGRFTPVTLGGSWGRRLQ